jgi:hypothetical protein
VEPEETVITRERLSNLLSVATDKHVTIGKPFEACLLSSCVKAIYWGLNLMGVIQGRVVSAHVQVGSNTSTMAPWVEGNE